MKRLVFVYGTLKRGQGNHRVMGQSKFLQTFVTEAKFTMYSNGGFPYVCEGGETAISGELFEVNTEEDSRRINRLEGYNGIPGHEDNTFYDVTFLETPLGQAEMFVSKRKHNLPIIENGIW